MKNYKSNQSFFSISLSFICLLVAGFIVYAQTPPKNETETVPERLRYFKEKYEENYQTNFDEVWNAVQKFIEEQKCDIETNRIRENDIGKQRGVCKSTLCIFAHGKDSTFRLIQRYALNPPFIRGGVWTSGRAQYRFIVNDLGEDNVNVVLTTELSGFEEHATFKTHFFNSNGLLEFLAFERLNLLINNQ